jgi:hypothetical protein
MNNLPALLRGNVHGITVYYSIVDKPKRPNSKVTLLYLSSVIFSYFYNKYITFTNLFLRVLNVLELGRT